MIKQTHILALSIILLALGGCDLYSQDEYEEYYVVESYLIAERPLPTVRLSKTLPVGREYTFDEAAVSNANVEINLLDGNGDIEQTFPYQLQSDGIYEPLFPVIVQPERRYRLHITFNNSPHEITAQTLVPGTFETVGAVVDSIDYQDPAQIEITTTRSVYPGRQGFFIFTLNAANVDSANLTPFYEDQVLDQDENIQDYAINSSGIINEENYEENEDGTLTLRVPWLAVAFYEENDITANAIDDNMYDFLRSQEVQGGGSTLPPGEIQNVIYNVEGGIGLFGSLASDTNRVFIRRNAVSN